MAEIEFWNIYQIISELSLYFRMLVRIALYRLIVIIKLIFLQETSFIQTTPEILQFLELLQALYTRHRLFYLLNLTDVEDTALMGFSKLEVVLCLIHELAFGV